MGTGREGWRITGTVSVARVAGELSGREKGASVDGGGQIVEGIWGGEEARGEVRGLDVGEDEEEGEDSWCDVLEKHLGGC